MWEDVDTLFLIYRRKWRDIVASSSTTATAEIGGCKNLVVIFETGMSLNIYLLLSRSHSPPSDRDFGPRSDISNDSIEKNGDPAARFEHQQRRWLAELKARNAKIVQVTYPRTANNDKELTVVRGEYLEVLRAIRWHIGCCRNRPIGSCLGVGQQPQVVEGPEHARRNGARAAHDRDAAGAGRRRFHSAFLCRLAQRQERWFALFLKRQIPPKKRKRKKGDRSCRSPWKKKRNHPACAWLSLYHHIIIWQLLVLFIHISPPVSLFLLCVCLFVFTCLVCCCKTSPSLTLSQIGILSTRFRSALPNNGRWSVAVCLPRPTPLSKCWLRARTVAHAKKREPRNNFDAPRY